MLFSHPNYAWKSNVSTYHGGYSEEDMKNRFCSFFIFIVFIDSIIRILRSVINLSGVDLSQATIVNLAEGTFSVIFDFLAVAQVIIAFRQKLKWAAKLIGFYPLFFTFVAMVVGIGTLITGRPHIDSANAPQFAVGLSIYMLLVGTGQLSLGIWAAKKLSSGHYAVAPVEHHISRET